MTGRQALDFQLAKLTKAIHLLWEAGLAIPALMLVYATIDALAWLQRENLNGDSSSRDFRNWVEEYLLPVWTTGVTSEALWAARCAMLHSQAAESRLSRTGQVPEIWYRWNDLGMVPLDASSPMLYVHPRELIEALDNAITRFYAALSGKPELYQTVEEQAMKWWASIVFLPREE